MNRFADHPETSCQMGIRRAVSEIAACAIVSGVDKTSFGNNRGSGNNKKSFFQLDTKKSNNSNNGGGGGNCAC